MIFLLKKQRIYDYFSEFASEALHIVIPEIFVKSMTSCLSKLKVTPSFCFAFKIPDDVTASVNSTKLILDDQRKSLTLSLKSFRSFRCLLFHWSLLVRYFFATCYKNDSRSHQPASRLNIPAFAKFFAHQKDYIRLDYIRVIRHISILSYWPNG